MRVIIAGGRDFYDYKFLCKNCDFLLQFQKTESIVIISGVAKGADKLGIKYAKERGYKFERHPANWYDFSSPCRLVKQKGKKMYNALAGFKRNEVMANNAEALILFWDGKSKGSKDMLRIAKEKNLLIRIVNY